MRILVTRPRADAAALAAALRARGHAPHLEAVIEIAPVAEAGAAVDLDGVQAILFTSANGVRAFAKLGTGRDLPVFAVGDASAQAARGAGFSKVESAAGDVGDLARLVTARLRPGDGALFHGAARGVAGDLKGALEAAGFTLRRAVLYQARAANDLSEATRTALSRGEIDLATFFSPRTAQSFVDLVQKANLAAACASADALCLSAAVATKLSVLPWRSVRIAARPNQEALLECIDGMAGPKGPGAVEGTMPADDRGEDSPAPSAEVPNAGAEEEAAAQEIIARFGGIRPMASKLGVAVSTVQGWRERGSIPAARHHQILAAAKAHNLDIDAETLAASDRAPEGEDSTRPEETAAMEDSKDDAAPGESGAPQAAIEDKTREPRESADRAARGGAWRGAFLTAAIVFAVGAGAAVLTREAWMPYLGAAPNEDPSAARIDALESRLAELAARAGEDPGAARIEALEGRLAELQSALAAADDAALAEVRAGIESLRGELSGLNARLDSLDEIANAGADAEQLAAALARIEARDAEVSARMAGEIAALRQEIATLAVTRPASSASESAMALAILQIRDALRGDEPFAAALNAIETLAAGMEGEAGSALGDAVAPLRPHAAKGAPSLESLQAAFPAVARAAIAQGHGGAGQGLWANAVRRLSALVSVRPLGPVEGAGAEAVVARAEAQLEAGNLASALRELDSLSGPAAAAAGPWRAQAEARLAVQAALKRLGGLLAAPPAAGQG